MYTNDKPRLFIIDSKISWNKSNQRMENLYNENFKTLKKEKRNGLAESLL